AHNVTSRKFHMKEAFEKLEKQYGGEKVKALDQITKNVVNGDVVSIPDAQKINERKRFFGIYSKRWSKDKMYTYINRLCDIIFSLLGLIILSPLLFIVAMDIKIESPGPILFYQDRIGLNKKKFKIYKFRTMYTDAPKNLPTFELENVDQHITRVGQIIRKRSIDELPQLINIIK